mmetsp:Transcript_31589/g.73649  ORF Transcript_31589/g.73649 Transcript_31589/m.73649 type:complete len:226 (+) Transcript_31589:121-798(+)
MGAFGGKHCCSGAQDEDDLKAACNPVSAFQSQQEEVVTSQNRVFATSSPSDTTTTIAKQFAPSLASEESTTAPIPTAHVLEPLPIDVPRKEDPSPATESHPPVEMNRNNTGQNGESQAQVDTRDRAMATASEESNTRWYSAVLQREPQEQLGLSITWAFPETALTVSNVGNGAVQRWNLTNPEAAIQIGHAIVSVNEITDPCEAAREMSMQSVVRLRLERKVAEE